MLNKTSAVSEYVKIGLEYIKSTDFSAIADGKYEILKDKIFVIVQTYHSKPIEDGKFEAHMSGKGAKYTRAHKPLKIVHTACFNTKSEAMKEECRIKKLTKAEKLEFLKELNIKI